MASFRQSLAVAVGIDAYAHGIPPLRTARADAEHLAALLEAEHGYATCCLLDEDATRAGLLDFLERTLPDRVGEADRVVFYFAGHGVALDGDDGPSGYLVPQDARTDDAATYLPMTRLHDALTALPCRHLLIILDCCFGGAFRWSATRNMMPLPRVIHRERYDRFIQDPAWQVITSASHDQLAADRAFGQRGESGRHSPFAQALFDALRGAGDVVPAGEGDGVITATELYLYLEDRLQPASVDQGARLTPRLWPLRKHDKGEYIFLVPGHSVNLPPAPPLTFENNPYRGLEAYEAAHADLFFGREELVDSLEVFVARKPLTVVLGASGTGKSSLVRAGVVPALERGGATVLPVMRPGVAPDALFERFAEALGHPGEAPEEALRQWVEDHPENHLVWVLDQFEELTTLSDPDTRDRVLDDLAALLAGAGQALLVILTLRTDYEPPYAVSALAPWWDAGRFVVPPMMQDELRAVIERPAAHRVLYFDPPSLVDDLINDVVAMPGGLPLLSFTLSEMYIRYVRRRSDDRALTASDYRALGGVVGALRTRAGEEYERLDPPGRETMRRILLRMVASDGGDLARRRVGLSELVYEDAAENERVQAVIERLSAARLVVRGKEGAGDEYVEPAHDALVRAWEAVLRWVQEEERHGLDDLRFQRNLARAAAEWQATDVKKARTGLLWRDPARSAVLSELLRRRVSWMNRRERAFSKRSVRSRRRIRIGLGATVGVIVLLALGAMVAAEQARCNAREATRQALEAGAMALGGQAAGADDATASLLFATQALRMARAAGDLNAAPDAAPLQAAFATPFYQALDGMAGRRARANGLGQRGWMRMGAYAYPRARYGPDGRWLVTGIYYDGGPAQGCCGHLWYLGGDDAGPVYPLDDLFFSRESRPLVAFVPGGRLLLTAHLDGRVRQWRLDDGKAVPAGEVRLGAYPRDLVVSPDGRVAAVADSLVRWWPLDGDPPAPRILPGTTGRVEQVAFTADDRWLLTLSTNGELLVWRRPLSAGQPPAFRRAVPPGDEADGLSRVFHQVPDLREGPRGRWLAVAGGDGRVWVWDLADVERSPQVYPHQARSPAYTYWVRPVHFSPDGRWLVTREDDGQQRIRDLEGAAAGRPSRLHGARLGAVEWAFDRESRRLFTWPRYGRAHSAGAMWDLAGRAGPVLTPRGTLFVPSPGRLYAPDTTRKALVEWVPGQRADARVALPVEGVPMAATADGRWLVVDAGEGGMLWDRTRPDEGPRARLREREHNVAFFTVSPEDRWLFYHDVEHTKAWDLRRLSRTEGPAGLRFLAADPAHHVILAGGAGPGEAALWDLARPGSLWAVLEAIPAAGVRGVQAVPGGDYAVVTEDGGGGLWHRRSGGRFRPAFRGDFSTMDLGPAGRRLITEAYHRGGVEATLWQLDPAGPVPVLRDSTAPGPWRFGVDGRLVRHADSTLTVGEPEAGGVRRATALATAPDGVREVMRTPDGLILRTRAGDRFVLDSTDTSGFPILFSPDGRMVAVGDRLWEVSKERPPFPSQRLRPPTAEARFVAAAGFSPDGRWLLLEDPQMGTLALCDTAPGGPAERDCARLDGAVGWALFSPGGAFIVAPGGRNACDPATAGETATGVLLWNLQAAAPAASAIRLPGRCPVSFSPDGGTLYVTDARNRVRAWPLGVTGLAEEGCAAAGRNLTQREWTRLLGDRPYACTCPALPPGEGTGLATCP